MWIRESSPSRVLMKGDRAVLAPPALAVGALWCGVVLLVVVGAAASVGRSVFRGDLAIRADPVRQKLLVAFHRADPFLALRAEELKRFDGRFAAHPVLTLLHVLPGAIVLILAPLQFSSRIRYRFIEFHRWSGRLIVLAAFVSAVAGLSFGLRMPYGGPGETTAVALFGGLFVMAVGLAVVAIRRKQVAQHREWMIRAFAIALGISTVRVISAVFDLALTPMGFRPQELFVLSLWVGWTVSLGAGEFWIRYTRVPSTSLE